MVKIGHKRKSEGVAATNDGAKKSRRSQCDFCNRAFNKSDLLIAHVNKEHKEQAESAWMKCLQCSSYFSDQHSLEMHSSQSHDLSNVLSVPKENKIVPNKIQCSFCPKKFSTTKKLIEHVNHQHLGEVKLTWIKCPNCPKHLPDKESIRTHQCQKKTKPSSSTRENAFNDLIDNQTECTFCNTMLDHSESLLVHVNLVHKDLVKDQWIKCPMCDFLLNSENALSLHTNNSHSSLKSAKVLREKNFACHVCPKAFSSKPYLNSHLIKIHKVVLSCQVCAIVCPSSKNLSVHMKKVHNVSENLILGTETKKKDEITNEEAGNLVSETIVDPRGDCTSSLDYLPVHKDLAKDQRIKCSICELSFRDKKGLELHTTKVHFSLRSVKDKNCHVCPRSFTSNSSLYKHFDKIHKTEVLFCPICKVNYSNYKEMSIHMKKSHKVTKNYTVKSENKDKEEMAKQETGNLVNETGKMLTSEDNCSATNKETSSLADTNLQTKTIQTKNVFGKSEKIANHYVNNNSSIYEVVGEQSVKPHQSKVAINRRRKNVSKEGPIKQRQNSKVVGIANNSRKQVKRSPSMPVRIQSDSSVEEIFLLDEDVGTDDSSAFNASEFDEDQLMQGDSTLLSQPVRSLPVGSTPASALDKKGLDLLRHLDISKIDNNHHDMELSKLGETSQPESTIMSENSYEYSSMMTVDSSENYTQEPTMNTSEFSANETTSMSSANFSKSSQETDNTSFENSSNVTITNSESRPECSEITNNSSGELTQMYTTNFGVSFSPMSTSSSEQSLEENIKVQPFHNGTYSSGDYTELADAIIMKTLFSGQQSKDIYFPINGPYFCVFCESVVPTNREFMEHVKLQHLEETDEMAMEAMQNYLRDSNTTSN